MLILSCCMLSMCFIHSIVLVKFRILSPLLMRYVWGYGSRMRWWAFDKGCILVHDFSYYVTSVSVGFSMSTECLISSWLVILVFLEHDEAQFNVEHDDVQVCRARGYSSVLSILMHGHIFYFYCAMLQLGEKVSWLIMGNYYNLFWQRSMFWRPGDWLVSYVVEMYCCFLK